MGYGTGGDSTLPTTFFKINGLKQGSKEIFFEGKKKEGSEYETISEKPTNLFGHLTEVSVKEFEWEDEKHKVVKLVLDSAEDRVILEGGFSNVMVNLVNTIAGNANPIDKMDLGVYISKTGYPSLSIKIDDQSWEDNNWKYDYKKKLKPLIEEVKTSKGKITGYDKTELVDFLVKEIESKAFQAKIAGKPPKQTVAVETPEVEVGDDGLQDDLPF